MLKILAIPNRNKTGFYIPSAYNRAKLHELLKEYKRFEIRPLARESRKSRGYLEGAVMPAYCQFQYAVDPKEPGKHEQQRFLFKRDFNYELVTDRFGNPVRVPLPSQEMATDLVEKYVEWAEENGAPIPNPDLYKLWRDKWSIDTRFPSFFEFLDFLGVECDARPTKKDLEVLDIDDLEVDYPSEESNPDKIPF